MIIMNQEKTEMFNMNQLEAVRIHHRKNSVTIRIGKLNHDIDIAVYTTEEMAKDVLISLFAAIERKDTSFEMPSDVIMES